MACIISPAAAAVALVAIRITVVELYRFGRDESAAEYAAAGDHIETALTAHRTGEASAR